MNGVTLAAQNERQEIAFRQYQKALASLHARLQKQDMQSMQVALITCVLLVCFDLISNRYKSALMHLRSGLGILDYSQKQRRITNPDAEVNNLERKFSSYNIDDDLQEPFELLEVQAIFFGIRRMRHQEWPQATIDSAEPLPVDGFRNVDEARRALEHLVECISSFIVKVDESKSESSTIVIDDTLLREQNLLKLRLQAWHLTAERLFDGHPRSTDLNATSLHAQYWSDWILLCTALDKGREMVFDRHLPEFQRIVDIIEACLNKNKMPSFSMNHAIIPALYYTSMKCRDPHLRRRAIALMQSQYWREGMWESITGAVKGTWLMNEEERGLDVVESAADVPEFQRVHQAMLVPRKGEKPVVVYRRKRFESDGRWVMFDAGSRETFKSDGESLEVDVSHWKL